MWDNDIQTLIKTTFRVNENRTQANNEDYVTAVDIWKMNYVTADELKKQINQLKTQADQNIDDMEKTRQEIIDSPLVYITHHKHETANSVILAILCSIGAVIAAKLSFKKCQELGTETNRSVVQPQKKPGQSNYAAIPEAPNRGPVTFDMSAPINAAPGALVPMVELGGQPSSSVNFKRY